MAPVTPVKQTYVQTSLNIIVKFAIYVLGQYKK